MIDLPAGGIAWHLVAFRIGAIGSPHCRLLSGHPSSSSWGVGMGDARETREDQIVLQSCWPARQGIAAQSAQEEDPLSQDGPSIDGPLMLSFSGSPSGSAMDRGGDFAGSADSTPASPGSDRSLDPDLEWISDCGIVTFFGAASDCLREGSEEPCAFCPATRRSCVARLVSVRVASQAGASIR
jgi:hypothetical protein